MICYLRLFLFSIFEYLCKSDNSKEKIMSCILYIETSTDVCSVAVSSDGEVIYHKEDYEGPNQARVLAPMVRDALSFSDNHAIPLDYVALSEGPGSYTGLRIGCSLAQGVCYGRGVKPIAAPTLKELAAPLLLYREDIEDNALFCPMIDARRMEVYTALYDRSLKEIKPVSAMVIGPEAFSDTDVSRPLYFFGNGAAKCKDVIRRPNIHFVDGIVPLAKNMLSLAVMAVKNEDFADVAYFEPFYLKEFVATKPRKLI